jgi:hypothetical protein
MLVAIHHCHDNSFNCILKESMTKINIDEYTTKIRILKQSSEYLKPRRAAPVGSVLRGFQNVCSRMGRYRHSGSVGDNRHMGRQKKKAHSLTGS